MATTPNPRNRPGTNPVILQERPLSTGSPIPSASTIKPKIVVNRATRVHIAPTFLFDKGNYTWVISGLVLILIGFFLMAGGKSADPHVFNYNEVYSFQRITLAPIVLLIGFGIEVYAIMKRPRMEETTTTTVVTPS